MKRVAGSVGIAKRLRRTHTSGGSAIPCERIARSVLPVAPDLFAGDDRRTPDLVEIEPGVLLKRITVTVEPARAERIVRADLRLCLGRQQQSLNEQKGDPPTALFADRNPRSSHGPDKLRCCPQATCQVPHPTGQRD